MKLDTHRPSRTALRLTTLAAVAAVATPPASSQDTLPPVEFPAENPFSEQKRVLGKILFFEEQLSSDNTTACGTCHIFSVGGTDPRITRHPGPDGELGNLDDKFGSTGVQRSDFIEEYVSDEIFEFAPQITTRSANSVLMAAFAPEVFWDGRAPGTFVDPESGQVKIATGGALESQVVAPPVSDVEMAHEARDWAHITSKLAEADPLALASNIPADMAAAIAANPTYPELFADAFGDTNITAERIAFSIATYERTLIPDDTPWDRFAEGDPNAMTPQQIAGWNAFRGGNAQCSVCHEPPFFTDHSFRNIGLRPWQEDDGRRSVTGDFEDRGRFKVPSLRNVGLKATFMHNGGIVQGGMNNVLNVVDFYIPVNGHQHFPGNIDPIIPGIFIPAPDRANIANFLSNALTDQRVANEEFPFDRPTLFSELSGNPQTIGNGTPGTGGLVPQMIATSPPLGGGQGFKIGVHNALGGATAIVRVSTGNQSQLNFTVLAGRVTLGGSGAGNGFGTWKWDLPDHPGFIGTELFLQWFVSDPAATNGWAESPIALITVQ